jgi:hypothetical protein
VGWLNPGWQPNHEDWGAVPGGAGRRRWLIPASRKPGACGEGGKERHRSGRNRIGGVGEVKGSLVRLSMVARVERGGASVRGRRSTR